MRIPLCIVAVLAALALCAPAMALAQAPELPDDTPGVSQQPPVPLDGDAEPEPAPDTPEPGPDTPAPPPAEDELANTGADTIVLLLAGAMMTLLGVALRLRTADAELY